jgi:DNA polymerase V
VTIQFGFSSDDPKSQALMTIMDQINKKYSKGTLKTAAEGEVQSWKMQRNYLSPNYTGNWNDLLRVK